MNFSRLVLTVALVAFPACSPDHGTPVRVATFNVRFDNPGDGPDAWPLRRAWVAAVIDSLEPDVLGLQEALVGQLRDLESTLPGYARVGVGRDDGIEGGEHSPVLFRIDRFELSDHGTIWLSETPDSAGSRGWDAALPRIATWVRLRPAGSGKEFVVVNTHFDHVGPVARLRSAELLRERFPDASSDTPTVLLGDFNLVDTTAAYRLLTSGAGALRDAWRLTGGPDPADTFTGFVAGGTPGPRIDYVFVSQEWHVLDARALHLVRSGRHPSDHRPVVADLRLD